MIGYTITLPSGNRIELIAQNKSGLLNWLYFIIERSKEYLNEFTNEQINQIVEDFQSREEFYYAGTGFSQVRTIGKKV